MSKNKSTLSQLGEMDIVYKLRWFILIGIIIFVSIIIIVKTNMDNEYQKYGYTGFSDNIKYDEWTNEIIPKNEIQTYNNDMKYITKSNGEKVYFADIKAQLNAYEKLQENYASINQENLEQVKNICDTIIISYQSLIANYNPCARFEIIEPIISYQSLKTNYKKEKYNIISTSIIKILKI